MLSMNSARTKLFGIGFLFLGLQGCASYYTHYAMFPGETSSGESRQIRVSWQTADYPGWSFMRDQSTTMKIETQCSDRVWRLADDSHEQAGSCGAGVRACGDESQDKNVVKNGPVSETACMQVVGPDSVERIADIGAKFRLSVSCRPIAPEVSKGGEVVNMDYLRASSVAYTVYARKVPRGSLSARLPEFDESVCKAD
ncbi:hypothetical protein [Marinobacter litoralis]|uniref:hypothetical protein n=1 Tax=Marinobacter litoralis TaxID=187981 RepID=UPI001D119717|nr:hypothetical protein [Marinobacter litoralis]